MLTITGINNDTLPLIETGQPERYRDIDGTHTLSLTVRETDLNAKAFNLIENEARLTLDDDDYIIKDIKPTVKSDTVQYEIEAVHKFHHDLSGNWVYDTIKGRKVLSLHQALTHLLPENYTFKIYDEFDSKSYEDFGEESSLSLFERIRVDYNFEYIKDGTFLKIYKQVGNETAKQMRYKHNIRTISGGLNSTGLKTHIEGYGKLKEDSEGNPIEGEYVVSKTYTSPLAKIYEKLHAEPVYDERFTDETALLNYMKSKLHDTVDISYDIEYDEFTRALDDDANVELGDSIYLIHEKLGANFHTRIVSITDYPLSNTIKPIYTVSSKKESLVDRQVQANTAKKNLESQVDSLDNNQSEFSKRIEKAQQAVAEVENAMIHVDDEMERIEHEVIPAVEQAVEDTKIPSQDDKPYPIPNSKLWNDTSVNPPRLKRWNGHDWVVVAPTEDEVDELIEQMKEDAVTEGIEYTEEEINAVRNSITNKLKEKLDVDSFNEFEEDYSETIVDITEEANKISQSISETNVRIDNLDLRGTNFIPHLPRKWEHGFYGIDGIDDMEAGEKYDSDQLIRLTDTYRIEPKEQYTLSDYPERAKSDYPETNLFLHLWNRDGSYSRYIVLNFKNEDHYVTFTTTEDEVEFSLHVMPTSEDKPLNPYMVHERLYYKLAYGDERTGWTPHLDDTGQLVAEVQEYVSNFEQRADSIEASVKSIDADVDRITGEFKNAEVKIGELEVTTENITTTVSELSTDVTSAHEYISEVDQKADGIVSTVRKLETNIGSLDGDMTSVKTEIEQMPDKISLAVSEGIDNLEIGGRNFISSKKENWSESGGANLEKKEDGSFLVTNPSNGRWGRIYSDALVEVKSKESIVASADVIETNQKVGMLFRDRTDGKNSTVKFINLSDMGGERAELKWNNDSSSSKDIQLWFVVYGDYSENDGSQVLHINKIKLEKGTVATDWSLAEEDRVNKTNVLSSINLSREGVKIEADKVDIDGVVEFINSSSVEKTISLNTPDVWEAPVFTFHRTKYLKADENKNYTLTNNSDVSTENWHVAYYNSSKTEISNESIGSNKTKRFKTPANTRYIIISYIADRLESAIEAYLEAKYSSTMIDGGVIISDSITASELNIDRIFSNSAVIAKIQADSVETADLSASRIRSGTLDAGRISVKDLSASSITGGTLDAKKVRVRNLDASEINTGSLSAERISAGTITKSGSLAVDIRGGGIETYDGSRRTSLIDGSGHKFYRDGIFIGNIGAGNWTGDANYRGLAFNMENNADYMTWSFKETPNASIYKTRLTWHKTSKHENKGFTFGDDVAISERHVLRNTYFRTNQSDASRIVSLKSQTFEGKGGVTIGRDSNRDGDGAGVFMTGARVRLIVPKSSGSNVYANLHLSRTYLESMTVYNTTSSNASNMRISGSGRFYRTTSGSKYKLLIENQHDDEDKQLEHSKKILDVPVSTWFDKKEAESYAKELNINIKKDDEEDLELDDFEIKRYTGLIAEHVEEAGLEEFIVYGEDGEIEEIQYDRLWIHLIPVVKEQQKQLEKESQRNNELENRIEQLEQLLA